MTLEQRIANIEAAIADIRNNDEIGKIDEDGATEEAIHLAEVAALSYKWKAIMDLLERGTKALAEEMRAVVGVGERLEIAGLEINHVETSFFDVKAWQDLGRGVNATPDHRNAMLSFDAYKDAEKRARVSESIKKSGGLRVSVAK